MEDGLLAPRKGNEETDEDFTKAILQCIISKDKSSFGAMLFWGDV
jgi:hypothetical protein